MKSRKLQASMKYKVRKTRKFNDILLQLFNAVYNQITIEKWMKACLFPFWKKKGNLGITKNYTGFTFTANVLNHIQPEIEKVLWKYQNSLWRNCSLTSQILTWLNQCRKTWKISRQYFGLQISHWHLIPYTEERWSKYFSHKVFQKKLFQL